MPFHDPVPFERFAAPQPERPASFAERGVAVPFTTPMLAGARLRRLPGETPDLLLPGLGGRGVYVLGWEACIGLAAPTLHDRHLWDRLATRSRLTPAALRGASRATAAQGYAGRAAQAAATAALQALAAARAEAQQQLSARLDAQLARAGAAGQVAMLAAMLAEVGVDIVPGPLLAGRLAAMGKLEQLAMAAGKAAPDATGRQAALLVAAAVRLTLSAVPATLAPLRQLLSDLPALFEQGDPVVAQVAMVAERPDWLLDGWDAIVAYCTATPPARQPDALRDALVQLPLPPQELEAWCGPAAGWDAVVLGRRRLAPQPRRVEETRNDIVLRQERARARAA